MAKGFPWDERLPDGRSAVVPALGRQMRGVMEIPNSAVPLGGLRVADNPSGPPMLPPAVSRPLALLSAVTGEAAPTTLSTPPLAEAPPLPGTMPVLPAQPLIAPNVGSATEGVQILGRAPTMVNSGNRLGDLQRHRAALEGHEPENNNSRLKSFLIGLGRGALQGFGRAGIGGALGGAAMGGITHGIDPSADEKYHRLGEIQRTQRGIGEEYKQLKLETDLETDRSLNDYRATQGRALEARVGLEGERIEAGREKVKTLAEQAKDRALASIVNNADEFDPDDPKNRDTVDALRAAGLPVIKKTRGQQIKLIQDARTGGWTTVLSDKTTGETTTKPVTAPNLKTPREAFVQRAVEKGLDPTRAGQTWDEANQLKTTPAAQVSAEAAAGRQERGIQAADARQGRSIAAANARQAAGIAAKGSPAEGGKYNATQHQSAINNLQGLIRKLQKAQLEKDDDQAAQLRQQVNAASDNIVARFGKRVKHQNGWPVLIQ